MLEHPFVGKVVKPIKNDQLVKDTNGSFRHFGLVVLRAFHLIDDGFNVGREGC